MADKKPATSEDTPENDKVYASRIGIILLGAISIGLAGPIAVNIHQIIHVLCAVKGECFGDNLWLEGVSALPLWNLLFGTAAAAMFILSVLSHTFIFKRVSLVLQETHTGPKEEIPSLEELKKASWVCMIFSSILWLVMLFAGIYMYGNQPL